MTDPRVQEERVQFVNCYYSAKEAVDNLQKDNSSEKAQEDEEDSKSVHSNKSGFSSNSKNLHSGEKDMKGYFKDKDGKVKPKKESILTWPTGKFNRAVYIILYPFHLLYWLIMPNLMHQPEIIKVCLPNLGPHRYFVFLPFLHWLCLCAHQDSRRFDFQLRNQTTFCSDIQLVVLHSEVLSSLPAL